MDIRLRVEKLFGNMVTVKMNRMLLRIEYDGTPFVGWQTQENGNSIQKELEVAAQKLIGEPTHIQGAGRTDSGVHAVGQAAHLDVPLNYSTHSVMMGLNSYLKGLPISVLSATKVGSEFSARFDAIERHYLYRILIRRAPPSLNAYRVWHLKNELDYEAMNIAAQYLVGKHDFTSFRASQCQALSPIRTMKTLKINKVDDEIHVIAIAKSFLHNQIRNITGTLVEIGKRKWMPEKLKDILQAKNRQAAGPSAPPHGLYLKDVIYPENSFIREN